MTTFDARNPGARYRFRKWAGLAAAVGAGVALTVAAPRASADTSGDYPVNGNVIQSLFGYGGLYNNVSPRTLVDLTKVLYAYTVNDYIGYVLGVSGSFSVQYGTNTTFTYNVPGRFSIGNRKGSLVRGAIDDNRSLMGFNEFGGGYPVWPLASDFTSTTPIDYDYCGFLTASVDGTAKNVGYANADVIREPRYVNGGLETTYTVSNNIQIFQQIKLLRSTARLQWVISNNDANPHTVRLRMIANTTTSTDQRNPSDSQVRSNGVYFVDPRVGRTSRPQLYTGGNIPTQIDILRSRVDRSLNHPDDVLDSEYGYHSRFILKGYDATPPDSVAIADSSPYTADAFNSGTFTEAAAAVARVTQFHDGLAAGLYWDNITLNPGDQRTIVTYFGNGGATEDLSSKDYVVATEALESLGYNADAVNSTAFTSSPREDKSKSALFYTPNPLTVYGNIYNRTLPDAQFAVILNNVTMSLSLPVGLGFAVVDQKTGATDTSSKFVGNVNADKEGQETWMIRPTGDAYGALSYQLITSIPNVGTSTITRTINVPATPFKSVTANNWQLISFPFGFDPIASNNGDPATIINGISLPADDNVSFYKWRADTQRYGSPVTQLETAVGYFYKPSISRNVVVKGVTPIANQAPDSNLPGTPVQVQLKTGWNLIGNPYLYSIPLNYLQIIFNNDLSNPLSFQDAISSGVVRGGVFFRSANATDYDFIGNVSDPIVPWEAYWIYANTDVTLKYLNPTQINSVVTGSTTSITKSARQGAIASRAALIANPTMDNWKLQIVAQGQDKRQDHATLIGMSRSAKDGDNILDLPKPIAPPSDYVQVGIVRKGVDTRFAQDMRAPGGTKTWDLEVATDKPGNVTLLWPNAATLPRNLRLTLKDTENNRKIDLRSASSFVINVAGSSPHRFQITATSAPTQPLIITNLHAVKVPGGRAAASGYSFAFTLNQDANMTLRILTQSGKEIALPAVGRAAKSGETRVRWDGRAQSGNSLPVGTYQVEVTARNEDGAPVVVRQPITLIQ